MGAPARRKRGGFLKGLISARRAVQLAVGVAIYAALSAFHLSLWWVLLAGAVLSLFMGKMFCRWLCPMGAIMEMMLGAGPDSEKSRNLYMYFKAGCPIAWVGGLLNRVSLWRVKLDASSCTGCTACDRACYVAQLAPGHSLHAPGRRNASTAYSCSRCLACVEACPTGALGVGLVGPLQIVDGVASVKERKAAQAAKAASTNA